MLQLGRYELVRRIGVGGMAEVYLARRRSAGGIEKRLVVKRIRPERASDPRFRQLFVREAELSMSLAHKNIVPVFDFGRVGDALFLVMELVDGPNLGQALARAQAAGAAPDPALVAHIAFEACQALDYAHRARAPGGDARVITHRDVTPGNVLLSFSGEIKLADFGVATAVLDGGDGRVRGTPAYMAPEQARGESADPRADLYALGLVVWESLTGQRAREGSLDQQLAAARAGAVPGLAPELPAPLAEVVARATAADPADRYADAAAMAAALDAYLLSARTAAAADPRPLGQRLASWLRELYPEGLPLLSDAAPPPGGPVATFLEDGAEAVIGTQTMLSMAATVDGPAGEADAADAEAEDDVAAPRSGRRRTLAAIALLGAGVALPWWWNGAGADQAIATPAPKDAAPLLIDAAGPADAAPLLLDAAVAADATPLADAATVRDAATPPVSPPRPDAARPIPDAAPPPPPKRPDAAVPERPLRAAARQRARGTLQISTRPWATVRVLGHSERCAETPCRLALPPGRYQLELENPIAGLRRRVQVEVAADTTTVVDELLTGRGER